MTSTEQTTNEEKQQNNNNQSSLYDELLETPGLSEDTAEILARNWKKLLSLLFIILAVVVIVGEFQASQKRKEEEASLQFAAIQKIFSSDELEEKAKFQQNLSLLQESYSDSIYSRLGYLYYAALNIIQGGNEEAKSKLMPLIQSPPSSNSKQQLPKQFIYELASLLYAKSYLSGEMPNVEEARMHLSNLSLNSQLVTIDAILTLYRISETDSERNEALRIAKEAISNLSGELASQARNELTQHLGPIFD
jgi:hypothetical protein